MGLDGVELVMDVEDHFGIAIKNSEAERVRTVGDLVGLIQSRIDAAQLAICPTLASFLRIRTSVRDITSDSSFRIRTKTRVEDVLNPAQRRLLWKRLQDLLGSAPSGLRRPPALRKILVVSALAAFLVALFAAVSIDLEILPLTFACAAVATIALHIVTIPFRICPPESLSTFGQMARRIAGVAVATKQLHLDSAKAVLDELRPIIVETLGVDDSEVVLSASFIEDLGMG